MARIVTGSVAEMTAPKYSVSKKEKSLARYGKICINPQIKDLQIQIALKFSFSSNIYRSIEVEEKKIYLPSYKSGNRCTDESKCKDCTKVFEKIFLDLRKKIKITITLSKKHHQNKKNNRWGYSELY